MQPYISNAQKHQVGVLEDLDLKCFDLCWDKLAWGDALNELQIRIVRTPSGRNIGFWAANLTVPTNTKEDFPKVTVLKIGVIPEFRRLGVSRAILRDIRSFARNIGTETLIDAHVAESLLDPLWEDCYIAVWLNKSGFTLSEPVMADAPHSLYGVDFQHAYHFQLKQQPVHTSSYANI